MGAILGLVNDDFHTNQFDRSGNPLVLGAPQVRSFNRTRLCALRRGYVSHEPQSDADIWFALGGLRPPYEAHGLQSTSTFR